MGGSLCWSVVVPVKPVRVAKSRLLGLPVPVREELVVAMAADTVAAALACPLVASVHVVTDDPRTAQAVRACGAVVVADEPDAGLNPALAHGAEVAALARPDCGIAALSADLPALTEADLGAALTAAGGHRRALVADADGAGTTLLTVDAGGRLIPAYGEGSRQLHIAGGATDLTLSLAGCEGLRRDVDTVEDLAAARRLGVGPRTLSLLSRTSALAPARSAAPRFR